MLRPGTCVQLAAVLLVLACLAISYTVLGTAGARKRARRSVVSNTDGKRVLVTGAAGFIGYHLAKTLAMSKGNTIVGLDNFNDYYDVRLKIDRAHELHLLGVKMHYADVCNQDLLEELFTKHKFTHVAHLAAQAGVRYSLQNPLAYIHSNVECQLVLLDVLSQHPSVKLIYASSSSVYGKESPIPFRLSASTDHPGNMYAATKKADELLGLHYCMAFNLTAIGLRFFTVYGPWGRPDMAIYKFADAIMDKKDLPMFHVSDDMPLERDFTYIDDIIAGVMAALDYEPVDCGDRFNLGLGHPVSVPRLVTILEEQLHTKANVIKSPMPPTEILKTWADITTSTRVLKFKPKISLTEGVQRFVTWYKGYRQQRLDEKNSGKTASSEVWFEGIMQESTNRSEQQQVERHEERVRERLQRKQDKYTEWARAHNVSLPVIVKEQFIYFQGVDSYKGNIKQARHLKNNIQALKKLCWETADCVAFTTNGVLKKQVSLQASWKHVPAFNRQGQGLYVADVDVCLADLHSCDKHAHCIPIKPAQYKCKCHDEYEGDGHTCLPVYGLVDRKELEQEYTTEYFNMLKILDMKKDKEMLFFPGTDSPGGDYLLVRNHSGDFQKLKDICTHDPICVGITTFGVMKSRIQPKTKWKTRKPADKHGIFVFDINYCKLSAKGCRAHASCQRLGPFDYQCQCDDGFVSQPTHTQRWSRFRTLRKAKGCIKRKVQRKP